MEVAAGMLDGAWLTAGYLLAGAVFLFAGLTAPWQRLKSTEIQHAVFGGIVALIALWWIRAGIVPGLGFHFLGVTTLTLMFGWQIACLSAIPVLLAGLFIGHGDVGGFGLNALLLFALPAGVTWLIYRLASRWLPWNFFIYVFINSYLAAALSMGLATLAMSGVQIAGGATTPAYLWHDYLPFLPLLLLAEGFINGMVVAVLVATRPDWVWTFEDSRYLRH